MAKKKGELTEEEMGEPVEVKVKRPLDKIVPIRLPADQWAELYNYAHELGVGPTTLARMWIVEKLAFIRATTSAAYAPGGVPFIPTWLAPAPLRLTFDQFMEKLVSALPDDIRQSVLQIGKDAVCPSDAEKLEDVKALWAPWGTVFEVTQQFFRAVAKLMGVEIVEEEADAKESKVGRIRRLNPAELSPSQIEKIIEIVSEER